MDFLKINNLLQQSKLSSHLFLNVLALCSKSNCKNSNSSLLQEVLKTCYCSF